MNEKPVIIRDFDDFEEAIEFIKAIEKAFLIWQLKAIELDEYTVEIFADMEEEKK